MSLTLDTTPRNPETAPLKLDTALLKAAADWAMRLHYDAPDAALSTDADRHAHARLLNEFEQWRQQSPAHDAAWRRAQSVLDTFERIPATLGRPAIGHLEQGWDRRRTLGVLSWSLALAPATWLAGRHVPWQTWTADASTAIGESRSLTLPDRSQLVLNTQSAVNIAFSASERRIRLIAGEILITTHPDPAQRPFVVATAAGQVQALGTRFSVRQLDRDSCRVAVFQSAVEVRPLKGDSRRLSMGEQADFSSAQVMPTTQVANTATLWEQGMLLARDMRLGDALAELARYRPGVLRCDPAVADLRLSGAIALHDSDASLALLAQNLPVRIRRTTDYWVTVGPR